MNKKELFKYLQTIEDKSGGFKKPDSIKKNYPEIYDELESVEFPKEYTFVQKLWHFLQDDYTIHRCKCGNPVHFIDFKKGYRQYCSKTCPSVIEYNKSTLQNAQIVSRRKESRDKAVDTIRKKHNGNFWSDEQLERLHNSYKDDTERCELIRQAIIKNRKELNEKNKTKIKEYIKEFKELSGKGISGCSSKVEIDFYKYLINTFGFENIDPQHYDNMYPYSCDFFIPGLNLYVEIQGSWTHGKHPFDTNNSKDVEKLNYWKSKDNEYYNNAIYTWTDLDVRKRMCAKDNHLNYLEIFSNDIGDCITIFEDYLTEKIVDYCMTQDLPGNGKWPANHPIWDCYVGKNISPRDAWHRRDYLTKAVKNIFYMLPREEDFRIKHIDELLKCEMVDGKIINSTEKFLQQIQDRFTIAKIAPKVTAISGYSVKRIIYESGINITQGVYVPMSGFGGIIDGVKLWGKEQNKEVECECYDINQRLCNWYGWKRRDMLAQKVVTDKVCICCPPFGKKYEHWDGTSNEMSDIDFKEWYHLIKEYVIAPEYIIIGPEIDKTGTGSNKGVDRNGKKQTGLFVKTVGIMRWTDEMVE